MLFYKQCRLMRRNSEQTLWIPEQFASPGKVLRLKQEDGTWDNGWVVINVGQTLSEKELPDARRDIKAHRKHTGDAMKKEVKT